jgi:Na+/phosphate symporter
MKNLDVNLYENGFPEQLALESPLDMEAAGSTPGQISTIEAGHVRPAVGRITGRLHKGALFLLGPYLFVLAIALMKEGASALAPFFQNYASIQNLSDSLGLGWIAAYLLMSGSPVAATSLTFFSAGALDAFESFFMIIGSRIGASFIVLFIGMLYVLRGHEKRSSLSMGLLSFLVSASLCLPALVVGPRLLESSMLESVQLVSDMHIGELFERLVTPLLVPLQRLLPDWSLFLLGLAVIMVSFSLIDRLLPVAQIKSSQLLWSERLLSNRYFMFLVGGLVTLATTSVSLSLSILVPLHQRGYLRREQVIPYIFGANVTTFFDTLLVALLLDESQAVRIVLTSMVSVGLVSAVVLLLLFRPYQRGMLAAEDWMLRRRWNFYFFLGLLFVTPLLLLVF